MLAASELLGLVVVLQRAAVVVVGVRVEVVGEGVEVELGDLLAEDGDVLVHELAGGAPAVERGELFLAPSPASPEHGGSLPRLGARLPGFATRLYAQRFCSSVVSGENSTMRPHTSCPPPARRPREPLLLPVLPAGAASSAEPRRKVETWATPGATAITVTGHGFGHGHGLSQYGALGAAEQGLTWQQIDEFYYPGTTWGRIGGKIRVLITADTGRDVQVVAAAGLKVTSLARPRTWRLPPVGARKWRLVASGDDTAVQRTKGGAGGPGRRSPARRSSPRPPAC